MTLNELNQMLEEQDVQKEEASKLEQQLATEKNNKKKAIIKEILTYVGIVVVAILIAQFITRVLIINAEIPSSSMYPTIMKGDRLFGNRLAYANSTPQRGDIVIFYYPDNKEEKYVKRVIGLPGETIEIHDKAVYVNGERLDETAYLDIETYGNFGPYIVPQDSYFVLGDNRADSWDSRYWTNKYVHEDDIIAKAWFRYYKDFTTY